MPVVLVYVIPLILKVKSFITDVTVIVPVATVQVGCVTFAVGAGSIAGWGIFPLTIVLQPLASLMVNE